MTKSINRLLREALEERAAAAAPTGCLDAETAAAFADDTLSAHERSGAEAHVADCARCQALLAALARTMPPAVTRAWWRRPAIAWLAPLTVAAAAAIVWVGIPRRAHIAPVAQSARAAAPSVETEASRPSPPAVVKEMRERYRTPSTNRAPETMRRDAPADKRSIAPSAAQAASAAPAPAAAAQPPSTPLPEAAPAPATAPLAVADANRPAAPLAPQRSFAEAATMANQSAGRTLARRRETAPETTIVSPNPNIRWRLDSGGVVQHSGDGGATWQPQATGAAVMLTAGSSPSPSVCWLVGPGAVVLVSTDEGRSWQRLAFPVAIDLVSVHATDDKTATVMTSDRRAFSTSDGGRTWQR